MGRIKKKNVRGNAANFITRQQALKKLQLTLPEFRKLCILKGIYPREPRKKTKGKDKTYYLLKDIMFLAHDPLVNQARQYQSWRKKVKRAHGRRDRQTTKHLQSLRPRYDLAPVVRERYPTFSAALNDMDDALCTIYLFASLPQTKKFSNKRAALCHRLTTEWEHYVIRAGALRRTFVSTRGIYYQAVVCQQPITWLVPHNFTMRMPKDVDERVMLSFLELYQCLTAFVLYRLYNTMGMRYPPNLDQIDGEPHTQEAAEHTNSSSDSSSLAAPSASSAGASSSSSKNNKKPQQAMSSREMKSRLASLSKRMDTIGEHDEEDNDEDEDQDVDDQEDINEEDSDDDDDAEEEEDDSDSDEEEDEDSDEESEEEKAEKAAERSQLKSGGAKWSQPKQKKQRQKTDADADVAPDDEEDADEQQEGESEQRSTAPAAVVFRGCRLLIGRECVQRSLSFVVRAGGGQVQVQQSDCAAGDDREESDLLTHQVCDRRQPPAQAQRGDRDYVQPQWVYDSLNTGLLLPVEDYLVGKSLPPHLSPFVDDHAEGYIPERRAALDALREKGAGAGVGAGVGAGEEGAQASDDEDDVDLSDEDEIEELEARYQKSIEAEAKGERVRANDQEDDDAEEEEDDDEDVASRRVAKLAKKKQAALEAEKEEDRLRSLMLPRRKRRLYQRIQHSRKSKVKNAENLMAKRARSADA
mmetsp:Transcript_25108/g.63117  ORF Transcript_25108/g.63117 Transcript_25108/m.63117 type:complete len:697 (-) Transcript_25108:140-2230(-)|eukprot:CAMPEP_0177666276 /NCGR_PEP_ID=MMETSP0447-20121125/21496_1 /TAXON_ID=0 /ORGANISM="Stygamoeba regulata, Strain BSH-02190019" /LENGTH=696 /DNA_ID=CAMNT_0019172415 /DNA_START=98 /DNA_END=2188 /DNA_ORIENTATION=+